MKFLIKIYEGDKELLKKTLADGVYRFGRSDFSDFVLAHDSISRSQMELRVTEAAAYITNMGTAGKIRVNGNAIETAEVKEGDEILVGPFKVLLLPDDSQDLAQVEEVPVEGAPQEEAPAFGEPVQENMAPPQEPEAQAVEPAEPQPELAPVAEKTGPVLAAVMEAEPPPLEGTAALARAETQLEIKPVVAKLIFVEGPKKGEEMPLEAYEVSIGRSKKADIFLDDEKLSRVHAKISRVGMGYRIIDLNSRNGTYVNGMRILEHPLSSFDEIEIGHSKIKFLIADVGVGEMGRNKLSVVGDTAQIEDTKSVIADEPVTGPMAPIPPAYSPPTPAPSLPGPQKKSNVTRILLASVIALIIAYFVLPGGEKKTTQEKKPVATQPALPANVPKEFADLTPEQQRMVEGYYNTAKNLAEKGRFDESLGYLKRIHEAIPFYKDSRQLQELYAKKAKEAEIAAAQDKAKKDDKEDLNMYLQEGLEYLQQGDFERAAEDFNSAIVIDPKNEIAIKGLKAAERKIRRIEDLPPDHDPEQDKRQLVAKLFQDAVQALVNGSYEVAVKKAEEIRTIQLPGDTHYLNEAKQIIDKARLKQKEEFEPFLIRAKETCASGDYNSCRDLCEQMVKRDPGYSEAQDCLIKAKKQLNKLAKEAYTHGYILESMNRLEEAKQYWNRAKTYVRPGDEYYDKVTKKLEYYQ